MAYKGSRNLDAKDSIARVFIHKFGDNVLLTSRDWLLKLEK